ncbi:YbgA family protein [Alkalihalophilus sp. As8PL]|uniref:YbgA family protein n=1 Tax=Alkalihalophilus sp. As8PL TaxID=3237103 RepID=A0AB39BTA3_9BACI
MRSFAKPRVVVSKCLEFEACRYNGERIPDKLIERLNEYVEFIPVCPEIEIGLGTPREVIRLVADGDETKLMQPNTGMNLTSRMNEFSLEFLGSLKDIDGFILKTRSPSCGVFDAKVYSGLEKAPVLRTEAGIFASHVKEHFTLVAKEDEGRLKNFIVREHFLTRLFTVAEFREVKKEDSISKLMQFQAKNKYLFMACNQDSMRALGRIVANHEKLANEEVFTQYEDELHKLFHRMPKPNDHINVCQHVFGYFSKHLTKAEKDHFLTSLDQFKEQKIPLSSLLTMLRSWSYRFENDYLLQQYYFTPYPESLVAISDSGKGRSLS